ncbi:MAG TPA: FimV/HubP family polar landmark protein [Methylotenera sp.]|nr:FimV/HubP family polar landmark protein [Methylotenera sp.]HPH05020.1 FimV/HubP family polar landmark protein [Methylotenera sp.]HPN00282.1 FimV/HubP family polar landmark protein [Methylotenera sp.]
MQKSKIKQISLAVCMALTPLSIYAAGLGKLNTQSSLGEPLRAEIEVIATPQELATIAASIAPEEAFAAQGVTRLGVHNNIKVELVNSGSGKSVLKLRSSEPIKDPYLDMIIQMDWDGGQLQREYTVLLDPPTYKPAEVVSETVDVVSPNVSDSEAVPLASATQSEAKKTSTKKLKKYKKKRTDTKPKLDLAVEVAADAQETTTKSGDTLTSIAKEMQVEGVSLDQMLAGLYAANQDAFIKGNINRLKVGQIIKVPTKESLTSVSNSQAKQVVRAHSNNWNAYRNSMAKTVANSVATSDTEEKQTSTGKITTAEDKAAAAKTGSQDVVKLSAGEKGVKSVDDKLVALQEETVAQEKSLKEGQERAAQLESQINDMKKVLDLKNQTLSEKQNAAASATLPAVSGTVEEVKTDAKVETPAVADASATSVALPVDASATTVAVPEVKVEEPKQEPVVEQKPVVPPAMPVDVPAEEPSFIDGLMSGDNNLPLIGGGLGLALLGAGWMFLRNKRKKNLDSFERGILTSGGLRANTVFGNTTSNTSTSDTSFLTDFAQSVDGGMIDTNDVDPIAEAEVYMAYGRGSQAEEILKDAILKEPKRYELHLKLLEIYVDNKDAASFETIAGELYTTLGADDPVWAKVATLGAKLEPDNPLYDLSKISVAATAATVLASDDMDFSDVLGAADESLPAVNALAAESNDIDFSLDDDKPTSNDLDLPANVVDLSDIESPQDIDFSELANEDVLDIGASTITEFTPEPVIAANENDSNLMDFEIGEKFETAENTSAPDLVADEPLQFNALNIADDLPSLDLPTSDLVSNSVEAEVNLAPVETLDFALDFELPSTPVAEVASESASKEDVSDFTFELPSESLPDIHFGEAAEVADLPTVNEPLAPALDLSSINLDLDAPTIQPSLGQNDAPEAAFASTGVEPPDVEIKLDLVAVYMDMDDKIGARELLEEVLKEGGASQKQRAQKLLDSIA